MPSGDDRRNEIVSGISGSSVGWGRPREARRRQRGRRRRAPRLLRAARLHDLADRGPVLVAHGRLDVAVVRQTPGAAGAAGRGCRRMRRLTGAAGAATGAARPGGRPGGGPGAPRPPAALALDRGRRRARRRVRAPRRRPRIARQIIKVRHGARLPLLAPGLAVRERRIDDDVRRRARPPGRVRRDRRRCFCGAGARAPTLGVPAPAERAAATRQSASTARSWRFRRIASRAKPRRASAWSRVGQRCFFSIFFCAFESSLAFSWFASLRFLPRHFLLPAPAPCP